MAKLVNASVWGTEFLLFQILSGVPTWAFGRTVMHLTFNQVETGSTPVAPTKFCPCGAIGRRIPLKPGLLQVRLLSGVSRRLSYGALWGLISLHIPGSNPGSATKCWCSSMRQSNRRCLRSVALSTPVTSPRYEFKSRRPLRSPVAQWWSNCPTNRGLQVLLRRSKLQILSGLPIYGSVA